MAAKRTPQPKSGQTNLTTEVGSGEWTTIAPIEPTVQCVVPGPPSATLNSENDAPFDPTLGLATMTEGRFVPVRPIGQGGMGAVVQVFDRVLRRSVAQKTMRRGIADRPGFALRFIEEAQITAQLDHPNIVPVYDLTTNEERSDICFSMKVVAGETLGKLAARAHEQPFSAESLERLLKAFVKVCDGVSFAHARGVLHLDLKPDNIMVGSHGQVYVMDWGVSRLLEGERSSLDADPSVQVGPPVKTSRKKRHGEPSVVGSPAFLSPEQAKLAKSELSERSDVYGLGAILYYLLTGRGPTHRDDARSAMLAARTGAVARVETHKAWPELPPRLCEITMKALAHQPSERYPSVEALREDVERFLRGGGWFSRVVFPPGSQIIVEGDPGEAAYIVHSGHCEVYKTIEGAKHVVRNIGPGEIFGETAVLTKRPRSATVVALDEVTCMVITREALARELEGNAWMKILVQALADRFGELDTMVADQMASAPSSRGPRSASGAQGAPPVTRRPKRG